MCDDAVMTKKPPSRGPKSGRTTAKSPAGKPAGASTARGPKSASKSTGKPGPKRPGWLPEPPPRGFRPPSIKPTPDGRDPHAEREASRYAEPIASREMILQVLAAADGPMTADELAQKLALTAPDRFDALGKRLGAMLRDGQLLQNRKGEFAPTARMDLIPGVVIANPDGFGFLRPDAGGGDDLFLPPFEMRKVMHGDRVMACVTGIDRSGRREGSIVEVLDRRLSRLIGRFTLEADISYVVPDDKRIQRNVMIPQDARNEAKPGQLVVAESENMLNLN